VTQVFHFGEFTLDHSRYQLQRNERRVRLEKIPMELLILLVQRRGDLVPREQIAEHLWGKDVFFDVDHSINVAIRKIRIVLHDDPEKPRFVETVVGKGYRFAAPVVCNNGDFSAQPALISPPPKLSSESAMLPVSETATLPVKRMDHRQLGVWLGGVVVLGVLLFASVFYRHSTKGVARPPITSLAVLPLRNLSGDPRQEFLADGMSEALIGRLARIHGLRVISRTSVMHFKDTQLSVPEIARMLGVDAIVEGSVIREGNQVQVHAQLIRAATDEHIWADEYQAEYRSVLSIEEDLTRSIAEEIEISVTPVERAGLAAANPLDPETHENYLKGRFYFNQRTSDGMNKSIVYFKRAITRDPKYALAYSGLADAYALQGFRGGFPSKDALLRAKATAVKAIELDDTLAEPHTSLAFIAETYEWDWAKAEREYKLALELSPNDARAHNWYAGYLMYVGRFEDGISEAKLARDLDPLSLPVNNALAGRLLVAGRVDDALKQVQKTLDLDSYFAPAHQTLGWAYLNLGKQPEAIQEFQKALQLSGADDQDLMVDLGFAYATTGNRDEARKILGKLKALHQRGLLPSGSIGILYGSLGELDEAFAWLDRAYEERDPELVYLKVPGRRYQPLRHDPRFQTLVRRVGLPE
jgi:TolB-like protein/DNA-binding winged helix-turn-helix (wHTH) protein/Flp pilus assembly protein TadD